MKLRKMKNMLIVILVVILGLGIQACGDKASVTETPMEEEAVEVVEEKEIEVVEEEAEEEAEVEGLDGRVGNEDVGFIDIPDNWINYKDINPEAIETEYSDPEGVRVIKLLVDKSPGQPLKESADKVYETVQSENPESMLMGKTEIAGTIGYKLNAEYRDAGDEYIWLFEEEEGGALHTITINGNRGELDDLVELVETTYSLEK